MHAWRLTGRGRSRLHRRKSRHARSEPPRTTFGSSSKPGIREPGGEQLGLGLAHAARAAYRAPALADDPLHLVEDSTRLLSREAGAIAFGEQVLAARVPAESARGEGEVALLEARERARREVVGGRELPVAPRCNQRWLRGWSSVLEMRALTNCRSRSAWYFLAGVPALPPLGSAGPARGHSPGVDQPIKASSGMQGFSRIATVLDRRSGAAGRLGAALRSSGPASRSAAPSLRAATCRVSASSRRSSFTASPIATFSESSAARSCSKTAVVSTRPLPWVACFLSDPLEELLLTAAGERPSGRMLAQVIDAPGNIADQAKQHVHGARLHIPARFPSRNGVRAEP